MFMCFRSAAVSTLASIQTTGDDENLDGISSPESESHETTEIVRYLVVKWRVYFCFCHGWVYSAFVFFLIMGFLYVKEPETTRRSKRPARGRGRGTGKSVKRGKKSETPIVHDMFMNNNDDDDDDDDDRPNRLKTVQPRVSQVLSNTLAALFIENNIKLNRIGTGW